MTLLGRVSHGRWRRRAQAPLVVLFAVPLEGCLTLGLHGTLGRRTTSERVDVERVRVSAADPDGCHQVEVTYQAVTLPVRWRWWPEARGDERWMPAGGWARHRSSSSGAWSSGWSAPATHEPFPVGPLERADIETKDGVSWLVLRRSRSADARLDVTRSVEQPTARWRPLATWALTPFAVVLDVALSPIELVAAVVWFNTYDGPWP